MRKSLEQSRERKRKTDIVLARIDKLIGESDDGALIAELESTFGIDYQHQADCTNSIPDIFNKILTASLVQAYGRDAIRSIKTTFATATASSLDYSILADFDGSVVHRYYALQREIQSICVDACNENGWVIPFTQITVHQSEA